MYTVVVEASFCATHRVRLSDGTVERPHEHDWVVRAHFGRRDLGEDCMVVDFSEARDALRSVLEPLQHADLNAHQAIAGNNPTAEVLARYVCERLTEFKRAAVRRVEVAEAPGCVAVFEL